MHDLAIGGFPLPLAQAAFIVWSLAVCPALAWFLGVIVVGEIEPDWLGTVLYFGAPVLATVAAGVAFRRPRREIIWLAVLSSAVAGLFLLVTVLTVLENIE